MTKDISRDSEAGRFLRAAVQRSKYVVDDHTGESHNPSNLLRGHEIYADVSGEWHRVADRGKLEDILTDLENAGLVELRVRTSDGWNLRVTPEGAAQVDAWDDTDTLP